MAEADPVLRELELQIKALQWRQRLDFTARQFSHALINVGPEHVDIGAQVLRALVVKHLPHIFLTEKILNYVDEFLASRWRHNIGKGAIIAAMVVVGIAFLKFWSS